MTEPREHRDAGKRLQKGTYLALIKKRRKESRIYKHHQALGLELAELLDDPGHKALYMKLAREEEATLLLGLAREVKERKEIRRKGAYFMRLLQLARSVRKK
jgi:hypothetical protein